MTSNTAAEALSRVTAASLSMRQSWQHAGAAIAAAADSLHHLGNHLAEARRRDMDEWIKANPGRRFWVRIN